MIRQGHYVDVLVMSIISPEAPGTGTDNAGPAGGPGNGDNTPAGADRTITRAPGISGEVRPPGPGDIPGMRRLYEKPSVLRNAPFLPWEVPSPQKIEEELGKASDRHVFVWADGDSVAGEVCVAPGRSRMSRTGTLSLMCPGPEDVDFSSVVARGLLEAAVDLGDHWLGLHRLQIETYADETWLFGILEELGFETEVRRRKASLREGRFEDRIVWARLCSSW